MIVFLFFLVALFLFAYQGAKYKDLTAFGLVALTLALMLNSGVASAVLH